MRTQLKIQDNKGFTLAIHAARGGDVALLGAVIEEIVQLKVFLPGRTAATLLLAFVACCADICWRP